VQSYENKQLPQARSEIDLRDARAVGRKERGLFETFIYGLLVLSAVVGIWQFAHLRVPTPFANTDPNATTQVETGS